MNYQLDTSQAKSAGISRITTSGKYTGEIESAEIVTSSQKGTKGVEFTFKADSGARVRYLSVWTERADGSRLSGESMIHAIMACCQIRNVNAAQATIKDYDGDRRAECLVDLHGKRIGLILQMEEYIKGNQEIGNRFQIVMPFHADTNRTAEEVLNQATAQTDGESQIDRIAESIHDKRLRTGVASNSNQGGYSAQANDSQDDDIPF